MEHRGRANAPKCSLNRLAVGHVEILPRESKALALSGGKPRTGPAEKTSSTGYQETHFRVSVGELFPQDTCQVSILAHAVAEDAGTGVLK